jgi:glycosyltransferase involved in cell wall biosynthesis
LRLSIIGPVYPLRGGIALHSAGLAATALERGHEVRVLSFRRMYPALFFPGRSQLDPGPPPASYASFHVAQVLDSISPPSWWRAGSMLAAHRADVVVLQRWHPFFAPGLAVLARAARRSGAAVVWLVHNVRPHETRAAFPRPLLTLGMQRSDLYLMHARSVAAELQALLPGIRCEVFAMPALAPPVAPVDPAAARRDLGIADDEVVFLFLGYVRAYKGVDELIEALAHLSPTGPRWRAIVAGEWYVERSAVERAIARPPLAGRVVLDDRYVPGPEVARYLAAATVVVAPYRDGSQSGVVPLAYAHGKGVIATRVGGLAEAVSDETGLLVTPGDAAALGAALEAVRSGRRFSPAALAARAAQASFAPIVAWLEQLAGFERGADGRPAAIAPRVAC